MGYELHIVRVKNGGDGETIAIESDEWLALVEQDSEMRVVEGNHAEWLAHPDEIVSFDLLAGMISYKHPDDPTLAKMIQIAKRLGAQVRGDENEIYDRADQKASNRKSGKRRRTDPTLAEKEALSYGAYFPAFQLTGICLRLVSIAVYTDIKRHSYFVVRRSRETVMAPLDGHQSVRPFGLTIIPPLGFRLTTRDSQRFTMIVSQANNWIRHLSQPETKVVFEMHGMKWKWIWPEDRRS
jgi:hypothetical protein